MQSFLRKQAERYIDSCGEYIRPYEREREIEDWVHKEEKTEKMVGDFIKRAGPLREKKMLEAGFGSGLQIPPFARAGAEMHGLEVNSLLLEMGKENLQMRGINADLQLYDGLRMPYQNDMFDYVLSTSVLEHVDDARRYLAEIARVLKRGGMCYLSFPNRWRPRETHTGVFFLSFLPRSLAQFAMRTLFRRNTMQEINLHFVSYFKLQRLLKNSGLRIKDESNATNSLKRAFKKVLSFFGMHHSAILGTVMVILVKE